MIRIVPVNNNKKLLRKFIIFPHILYKDDENYVPELFIAQRDLLTPGNHPFHENAKVDLFMAFEGNVVKGRIAAIFNRRHNEFNNSSDGFFGFFDCVDEDEPAIRLFEAVTECLKEQGVTNIIGPVNPSTNDPCSLLIDSFDQPPVVMMTYNKPYYLQLIESAGFSKKTDLLAYIIKGDNINLRSVNLHKALLERLSKNNITIRTVNMRDFKSEAKRLRLVYNAAWDKNLGFVPMTENEFNYLAKDLKMIVNPKFCLIAEKEGKMVGFALAVPDINQTLIKIKNGRLFPVGIFKLLLAKKRATRIRVLALGVMEGYKKLGIEACFYASIIEAATSNNIIAAECSWILENNFLMNKGIQSINGTVYKRYRLFEKII